ncbi:MAG: multicopper oxidase domain-containing protein [Bacteroidota bacterium]|jgi:FtsP/CotA-like multicopper oxidase with cupredoxin domain
MKRILLLSISLFVFFGSIKSTNVNKRLYINRGVFTTVKNTTFPFLAFNSDTSFNQLNEVLVLTIGDTLTLTVLNNDFEQHGFSIKNTNINFSIINPGDSIQMNFTSPVQSAFVYYDNFQFPKNRYLGLAGIIYFRPPSTNHFYFWNIKEHQTAYSNLLAGGATVNWNNYQPDYYTINSKSFPDLQTDSVAKIDAHVGDTVYIVVANTGQSAHSLHFHGFHTYSVYSDAKILKTGWDKDTWGMFSMDVLVLRMVPDKPGRYSVHDHNLVAITGGNTHPNGMFTIMDIAP